MERPQSQAPHHQSDCRGAAHPAGQRRKRRAVRAGWALSGRDGRANGCQPISLRSGWHGAEQDDRFPPEAKKLAAATKYVIRAMQITLPIGLPRLLASRSVPKEVQPEFCAVFCRLQFIAAVRAEAAAQDGKFRAGSSAWIPGQYALDCTFP